MLKALLLVVMLLATPARAADSQQVVTLSPHLAELMFLLGAGDRLVGVSEYSDYPVQAKSIPRIGGAVGVDAERILSLAPDLVLAWQGGTRETDIALLRKLGLNVVSIKGETLEDIPLALSQLGSLLGRQQAADREAEAFRQQQKELHEKYAAAPRTSVFIQISIQPLMALSGKHTFSAGLEACNAVNVFTDLSQPAAMVDLETILARHPRYILVPDSVSDADAAASLLRYRQPGRDNAVEMIRFDADRAFRQTPRLLGAVAEVCDALHQ